MNWSPILILVILMIGTAGAFQLMGTSLLSMVILIASFVVAIVLAMLIIYATKRPPALVVSSDLVRVKEGTYDTRALQRIEVFMVTPPQTDGDYAIVFIFEREDRPSRVPLFVTGVQLKAIIMGIQPILGHVSISIKIKQATPVKLVL